MKFVTYRQQDKERVGVLSKDEKTIIDLSKLLGFNKSISMIEFIEGYKEEYTEIMKKAIETQKGINIGEVELQAPIPIPRRNVICLGKNYKDHVKEVPSSMDFKSGVPEYPIYFTKLVNRAVASGENIPSHKDITNQLDYEVELAIIIAKDGKNIPKEKVEEYIFGYTILNDVSVRNIQQKHGQWFLGKSLDGTCPMGPCLVHKSAIKFPVELEIKSYVNGELRQHSNTRNMIFDIPYIISELSMGVTLKAGDIISTGTPSGVGMGFNPPKFLKEGDKVVCEIEGIGRLENIVR